MTGVVPGEYRLVAEMVRGRPLSASTSGQKAKPDRLAAECTIVVKDDADRDVGEIVLKAAPPATERR